MSWSMTYTVGPVQYNAILGGRALLGHSNLPRGTFCNSSFPRSLPDDNELGVLRAFLDVVGHDRHVLEVQRCVDLVHHVQRRGL